MNRVCTGAVVALLFVGCASEPRGPEYANDVERIMWTLASDEMLGRQAFEPSAWEAAGFIASEFEAIGLETFQGDEDYFQEITVSERVVSSMKVTIAGEEVGDDAVTMSLSSDAIAWDGSSDITRIVASSEQDMMGALQVGMAPGQTLVLVSTDLAGAFPQMKGFFDRPSRTAGGSSPVVPGDLVIVLTDHTDAADVVVEATTSVTESEITNVVGVLPGNRSDEYVVFSGHYDHLGTRDEGEDTVYNGANDNASGTTATIQLARHFAEQGTPERTLLFVGFTAEESGGFGSRYFSEQLDPEQIVAMFNIEMIGKPAVEGPNTAWITGFERSDFGTILQEAVEGTDYTFYPDPYPDQNLFYRSDNATLARLGVPAHSISTTPIDVDPDYHQVSDEVPTVDLDHLANTIEAIAAGATLIVSGERTPTRIDPSTVN